MRVRNAIAVAAIGTTAGLGMGRVVRWWRTWGSDPMEAGRSLPGDELVPTPTAIDTRAYWETAWRAISCHQSQITAYERLKDLSPASHEALWGWQTFYRAFSLVNGGRHRETDLFEGLRAETDREVA